jgi:hypothetical protein
MSLAATYTINTAEYPGIIKVVFKDNYDFTLQDSKDLVEELKKICVNEPMPILKIPGKFSSIDSDVRSYISSVEGMQCSSAEAIVTTYLPQRLIGNFYLKINKPVKPTILCDTEETAVRWLEQFKKI